MSAPLVVAGLDRVASVLERILGERLMVGEPRSILGPLLVAGTTRPLVSSAAELRAGEALAWLPTPSLPATPGTAPVFVHGGHRYVFPFVRLLVESGNENGTEYLTLSHWLEDALGRWRFPALGERAGRTLLEQLEAARPEQAQALRVVARMVRYALLGADQPQVLLGLRLPACPMWLRPVEGGAFAEASARALVISARLREPRLARQAYLPSPDLRAAAYRIRPAAPRDFGLDPVHTPEGGDIRLTARLGVGVTVSDERRLVVADGVRVPLSPSSSRLPYAGYNDPRRLLMAANMQTHAMPLLRAETPLVRVADAGLDPPGVNLRVGYLAWQGWNHEDAWLLSESGARKLAAEQTVEQVIAVRAVEMLPRLLVRVGDTVRRGQLLVERRCAPLFLCSSLAALAELPAGQEQVELQPEFEDRARLSGEVSAIDEIDLLRPPEPPDVLIPEHLQGQYRAVYRVRIRRMLPLQVGDKLANRHGHKGIVGQILPDTEMPRWRDEPLEALIDPISVLNRSNWGQVLETLAGAVLREGSGRQENLGSAAEVLAAARQAGTDERGRFVVEPPRTGAWLRQRVPAVAGYSFVLRLPHHAQDKLSCKPLPPGSKVERTRAQRFGEMDSWALWAHGFGGAAQGDGTLTPEAAAFGRLLGAAGYELRQENGTLVLGMLDLGGQPPAGARVFPHQEGSVGDAFDLLESVAASEQSVLVLDPPLGALPEEGEPDQRIAWLPILPARDRRPRIRPDGSEEEHELTRAYRAIVRVLRRRKSTGDGAAEDELRAAVAGLMDLAFTLAVGRRATGTESSKQSCLRRSVLGRRLSRSGRATVTPAGNLGLGVDEIGLPPDLARCLFGPDLPADDAALAEAVHARWIWIKRDPVLHRWGLLPVRVRVVPGSTIRLPASLLGPMGADFDGDTMAVFAALPGVSADLHTRRPSTLAWHPLMDKPMFAPGKQFLFGLHLLVQDPVRLEEMQTALRQAGAPAWPTGATAGSCLNDWLRTATQVNPLGHWWAIVESFGLLGLAQNPTMDFGWYDVAGLADLPVVRVGAAKSLYDGARARQIMADILGGKSLQVYESRGSGSAGPDDPIAEVMVASKAAIGKFGGALRRLIFTASPPLRPETVAQAQALTEQVTQKALSVKAGKPPVRYAEYEAQLRRLLRGEFWNLEEDSELAAILKPMQALWEDLRRAMPLEPPSWLLWLRKPHALDELLRDSPEHAFRLPLDDLRLSSWLAQAR